MNRCEAAKRDKPRGERFCDDSCDRVADCSKRTWWVYGYPQECDKHAEYREWCRRREVEAAIYGASE